MSRLFVSGNYSGIIDLILHHLTGVDLTALQLAHPVLAQFIQVRPLAALSCSDSV